MAIHVGFLEIEILLPTSGGLKDRRRVVKGLLERLRARHNLAGIDVSEDGIHRRGGLAFVSLADSRDHLERLFDRILDEAERQVPGGIREVGREMLG